jgi:hypothetical protein
MGASCKSVQDPDSKRRVRMPMRSRGMRHGGFGVNMKVGVTRSVVLVRVGVDANPHGQSRTPKPDSHEHHPDRPFAHRRKALERKNLADAQQNQPHCGHAGRMSHSPAHSGTPRLLRIMNGQRCNRSQMIRPRKHMHNSRRQS